MRMRYDAGVSSWARVGSHRAFSNIDPLRFSHCTVRYPNHLAGFRQRRCMHRKRLENAPA
jgi:hypothetical protein